jgi:hypothetical protein
MNHKRFLILCFLSVLLISVPMVIAKGPMVSALGNKHNLSAQNTGVTYHAIDDKVNNPAGQQICIFCHTPHSSSSQGPLWNRKDTSVTNFARYSSSTLQIKNLAASGYAGSQPNGSSRLCLSCHDGVTPLGGVINSGQSGDIQMEGGNTIDKTGVMSFHPDTNKMKIGHHPVSFIYATGFNFITQTGTIIGGLTGFTLPVNKTMETKVKLQDSQRDGHGWMQCTTCHNPHQNMGNDVTTYPAPVRKVTPFWVYSASTAVTSHETVCLSCHSSIAADPYNKVPWPTP